jgi:hypothetical protein
VNKSIAACAPHGHANSLDTIALTSWSVLYRHLPYQGHESKTMRINVKKTINPNFPGAHYSTKAVRVRFIMSDHPNWPGYAQLRSSVRLRVSSLGLFEADKTSWTPPACCKLPISKDRATRYLASRMCLDMYATRDVNGKPVPKKRPSSDFEQRYMSSSPGGIDGAQSRLYHRVLAIESILSSVLT